MSSRVSCLGCRSCFAYAHFFDMSFDRAMYSMLRTRTGNARGTMLSTVPQGYHEMNLSSDVRETQFAMHASYERKSPQGGLMLCVCLPWYVLVSPFLILDPCDPYAPHSGCAAGKNRGPAKPCTTMLWMSMLCSLGGLQILRRMKRPDLRYVLARCCPD